MIQRIRYAFLARTLREKFMVLVLLLVGAIIWLTFFSERLDAFMETRGELARQIEFQETYLANQDLIEERVEAGIDKLDAAETLDGTRLVVEVGRLARNHGLSPSTDAPSTEEGDVFSYHTVSLTLRGAEIASLINFTSDLQRRAPYIGIDEVIITADRGNPLRLDARYRISAVELAP